MSEEKKSHKQILRSTSIVGGSQIFSIIIGIIRTKVLAILMGPTGIGYIGILQNIIDLVKEVTGFGINFSGVKDIAAANGSNDELRISRTILILRRWAIGTGVLGMLLMIIFCIPLSKHSFGNTGHAASIAIVSVAILIGSVSSGQLVLLQGLRKIDQLAMATLYGSILGLTITLPLYWWLGIDGIIPGMVLTVFGGFIISWWFSRKVKVLKVSLSFKDTIKGGVGMVKLGLFITITGFMITATLYLVRSFLLKKMNLDGVGYFQACWMISNLYLGIVLNAMLADFFPRLTEVNKDNVLTNKLVNEQTEIALLVASPMIVGIITLAQLIINILYSHSFSLAIPVLQWQIAGTLFTLLSWPQGVMFLSKGKGILALISEGTWACIFLMILYFGWGYFGFLVLGIAYAIAGFVRLSIVSIFTRNLSGFRFSKINYKFIFIYGALVVLSLCNVRILSGYIQYAASAILILTSCLFSYYNLNKIIDINKVISSKMRKIRSN